MSLFRVQIKEDLDKSNDYTFLLASFPGSPRTRAMENLAGPGNKATFLYCLAFFFLLATIFIFNNSTGNLWFTVNFGNHKLLYQIDMATLSKTLTAPTIVKQPATTRFAPSSPFNHKLHTGKANSQLQCFNHTRVISTVYHHT